MPKRAKKQHLKPVTIVKFNSRLGKAKPIEILALLDSGGAGTLVTEAAAKKLRLKESNLKPMKWTTPAGEVSTKKSVKTQMTLPEFYHDRIIEWDYHVAKSLGMYDMIIGRDLLKFLGIDIRFSNETAEWDHAFAPFKDMTKDCSCFYVDEPEHLKEANERIQKILEAKYEPADLEKVCAEQEELSQEEQQKLLQLLNRYKHLFDGTLGTWTDSKVSLDVVEGAKPHHAKAFTTPRVHMATLKSEVERLVKLGALKRVNRSQWAAPTFIIPKKDGTVRFISDFRELNKRIDASRIRFPVSRTCF